MREHYKNCIISFSFSNVNPGLFGKSESHSAVSDSLRPHDYTVHRILQTRILEWVAFPFSKGYSQPRDETQVSHMWVVSLSAEPPGKPKNTGVGNLSLLQGNLPNPGITNWHLLPCRRILYQLSYHEEPGGAWAWGQGGDCLHCW